MPSIIRDSMAVSDPSARMSAFSTSTARTFPSCSVGNSSSLPARSAWSSLRSSSRDSSSPCLPAISSSMIARALPASRPATNLRATSGSSCVVSSDFSPRSSSSL
jgi:hypothetical protein